MQALIVNKLIKELSLNSFVIYYPTGLSKKHKHYFDLITGKKFFIKPKFFNFYIVSELCFYVEISKLIRKYIITDCYYASIGGIASGLIIKKFDSKNIFTFDDGTFNIKHKFFNNWIYNESKKILFYKKILGISVNSKLVDNISKHYTIYNCDWSNFNNKDIKRLILWDINKSTKKSKGIKKILIGTTMMSTPITDDSDYIRIKKIKKFIDSFDFDIYIPHPAEVCDNVVVRGFTKKETNKIKFLADLKISEDIVIEIMNMGYRVNLFGFGSTALINLSDIVEANHVSFSEFAGEEESANQMRKFNVKRFIVN